MNVTVTDQENCKKQLHLEIPGEVVRAETDKVAGNLARQVNIPGFRPGHAPKSVIKTRFRKELRDEVVAHLLPESLQKAITDKDLKVIGEPAVDDLKFGDDDALNVTITVSVKPEFEIGDYKGLALTQRVYKIRDQDIDQEIERLRDGQAEIVPVEDRGAQTGDIVTVSLTGRLEAQAAADPQADADTAQSAEEATAASDEAGDKSSDEASDQAAAEAAPEAKSEAAAEPEEIKQDDVEITLGGANVLKEFTEALSGVRPGDERRFTVAYPAEYKPERFAGRKVDYTATVTAVRAKELPEVDDVFAQGVDEKFQTLDELRADLRHQMEHQAEHRGEDELRNAAMEALIERYQFAVPDFILERQINSRFNTLLDQLFSSGIDPRQMRLDWEEIRAGQRERAERDVRGMFILDRIADDEKIEVSEEDLNHEIEAYAAQRGETVAAAKARLTKEEALDSIKEQVRQQKALDLVIASAALKTEEVEGLRAADAEADQPEAAAAQADKSAPEAAASAEAGANPAEAGGE
ncbi:MAG TPA: trigger factor [Blastocatellia bacterium]|nr:trigger factor [Blastocatellia bacterium]